MEAPAEGLDYSAQRDMLPNADLTARLQLAQAADTRPEILYFLAGDEAVEVRQAWRQPGHAHAGGRNSDGGCR